MSNGDRTRDNWNHNPGLHEDLPRNKGDRGGSKAPNGAPKCADGRAVDVPSSSTRTRLARALADVVAEALAEGDAVAARIGLEALERLTGEIGEGDLHGGRAAGERKVGAS